MQITMIISTLDCGGAEKVISNMANYWVDKGHNITIIKFDSEDKLPFYWINPKINVVSLNIMKLSKNLGQSILNNIYLNCNSKLN